MRGRRGSGAAGNADIAIEGISFEAMLRLARSLARTGMSRDEMMHTFGKACRQVPQALVNQGRRQTREMIDASHVLTVWYSDPKYVDANGEPVRLRADGETPSLKALIKAVDGSLDAAEVIRYLTRARAIERIGTRYAPLSRAVKLRGSGGAGDFLGLRMLVGLLRNIEHNSQPEHRARRWFQRVAENHRFPVRARVDLDEKLEHRGMGLLEEIDGEMQIAEQKCRPGEPTVRMAVAIFRFEDELEPEPPRPRKRKSARKRRLRRRHK